MNTIVGQIVKIVILAAISLFAAWVVLGPRMPQSGVEKVFLFAFFFGSPLGAIWLLYDCLSHPKTPRVYLLLGLVPYAFVFYYFEHVRLRNRNLVPNSHAQSG
jgi:hypothetical protein